MPKKTVKAAKKKSPAKAKKPTTKPKLKTAVKLAESSKGSRRGFMWKVLEQKQKQPKSTPVPHSERDDHAHPTATSGGYARFNGPRRRVG